MNSRALKQEILACMATLLVAAVPLMNSSCRNDPASALNPGTSPESGSPKIVSIVPNSAPLSGGTTVIINGSDFASGTQPTSPSVSFGGVAATNVRIMSSLQISAKVPPHVKGKVPVKVTTADGNSTSVSDAFTYTSSSPAISSVSPGSGGTTGGTVVTITGSNFASGATVAFGGSSATNVSFVSSTQLKATTPAHANGSVNVAVTNPDGVNATLAGGFTFGTAALSVNSVSPISGPAAGGTRVTISGSDFQTGVSVNFGGLGATSVSLTNSSTLVAVTPVHSSASVAVTVTNSSGKSASLPSGFTYHSIDLAWSAPSTSPVTIAGYNIYRGNTLAGPFGVLNGSSPLATTSFEDATVEGGTTYYYEVKSVDTQGVESPPAGPVPATTAP